MKEMYIMVKNRSIAVSIILSLVTCGFYSWYWLVCLNDDLNKLTKREDTSGGVVLILTLVTCGIYGWYWLYKSGEKVDYLKQANGETPASSAIVYLLLGIFGLGIISYALIQDEINKNAEQVI